MTADVDPRHPARIISGLAGVAVLVFSVSGLASTIALARADVFLVGWEHGRALRVAWIPTSSEWLSSLALAVSGLIATALVWRRRARGPAHLVRRCVPLTWLSALVVPYLPGLADVVPALVVFAGPLRWAVVAAVAWATIRGPASCAPTRRSPYRLGVAAFLVYVALGAWVTSAQGVGGDEPHYLVITESLLRDGDLRIEDNHARGDYRRFYPGDLSPHFLRRGVGGAIYSVHAPGLPALVLPAYAIGGRSGVNAFMSALATLAGLAVFLLARVVAGPGAALVTWIGVAFTTPFLMHGWLIYPEMAAACVVAWSLWWIAQPASAGAATWMARGVALATLPWLHTKFAVLLACLGLACAVRERRRPAALVCLAIPIVVSLVAWLGSFVAIYGVADPTAPYGGLAAQGEQATWRNLPRGLLGLAFDQEFGLFLYTPFYALAIAGVVPLLRQQKRRAIASTAGLTAAVFLGAVATYYMWWGGWSVPARFVVPALPLVAPFVAAGVSWLQNRSWGRAVVGVGLSASLAMAAVLVARPAEMLMFNERDGSGRLLEWLQGPAPLTRGWPSFVGPDWVAPLPALATLIAGAGLAFGVLRLGARYAGRRREAQLPVLLVVGVLVALAGAASIAIPTSVRKQVARDGQLSLLRDWRPDRGFDASAGTPLTPDALRQRLRVPLLAGEPTPASDATDTWLGPWWLPPGAYELNVWMNPTARHDGAVFLRFHRTRATVAHAETVASQPVTLRFDLPDHVAAPPLWLGVSDPDLARSIARVELVPTAIRGTAGDLEPVRAVENIGGSDDAFIAYLDREAFPEGGVFWTRGESQARLLVSTRDARSIRFDVETGAAAGLATVEVDGVATTRALPPRANAAIDVTLAPEQRHVQVRIGFTGGFRPRDVEDTNDGRWLGLRVRPQLE